MNWYKELDEKMGYMLQLPESSPVFDPQKKHDFVFLFDATNCNPNGDPDNDNLPRQDFESYRGLVTDVCLKRKIRDFVARVYGTERENPKDKKGFYLYVKHKGLLREEHRETADGKKGIPMEEAQKMMRERYWDVRLFGAVLSVGKEDAEEAEEMEGQTQQAEPEDTPAPKLKKDKKVKKDFLLDGGQCVGPMQIGFAESKSDISPQALGIVRDARVSNPAESKELKTAISAMPGAKPYLPYGLYECRGHYSPCLDKHGLVTQVDLALFWNALRKMFESDISSARPGAMNSVAVGVFTHEHRLGNYPAHRLFDRIELKFEPNGPDVKYPRSYRHYKLKWPEDGKIVAGVTFTTLFNDWQE